VAGRTEEGRADEAAAAVAAAEAEVAKLSAETAALRALVAPEPMGGGKATAAEKQTARLRKAEGSAAVAALCLDKAVAHDWLATSGFPELAKPLSFSVMSAEHVILVVGGYIQVQSRGTGEVRTVSEPQGSAFHRNFYY
jgi:hypothetical protein